jgi:hypothetical protein
MVTNNCNNARIVASGVYTWAASDPFRQHVPRPHSPQGSQLHDVFLRQDSTRHALENPYSGPTHRCSPLCATGPPEELRRLTYSTTLVSGPSTLKRPIQQQPQYHQLQCHWSRPLGLHTPVGASNFPSTLPLNFHSPRGGGHMWEPPMETSHTLRTSVTR